MTGYFFVSETIYRQSYSDIVGNCYEGIFIIPVPDQAVSNFRMVEL